MCTMFTYDPYAVDLHPNTCLFACSKLVDVQQFVIVSIYALSIR